MHYLANTVAPLPVPVSLSLCNLAAAQLLPGWALVCANAMGPQTICDSHTVNSVLHFAMFGSGERLASCTAGSGANAT